MKRLSLVTTAALIALLGVPAVNAQVLGSAGLSGADTDGPNSSLYQYNANDFTLSSSATIKAATFFAEECCKQSWAGTIQYFFYQAAAFPYEPGILVAQGTAQIAQRTVVYSDAATNVVEQIDFNLEDDITLSAGQYYLGLFIPNGNGASIGWLNVQDGGLSAFSSNSGSDWSLLSGDLPFEVDGSAFPTVTATPEPATLTLMATGLMGVFGLAVRRKKASGTVLALA